MEREELNEINFLNEKKNKNSYRRPQHEFENNKIGEALNER